MKTTLSNQNKLSVLSLFVTTAKFFVGIFSWIVTILFMIVVLIATNTKKESQSAI